MTVNNGKWWHFWTVEWMFHVNCAEGAERMLVNGMYAGRLFLHCDLITLTGLDFLRRTVVGSPTECVFFCFCDFFGCHLEGVLGHNCIWETRQQRQDSTGTYCSWTWIIQRLCKQKHKLCQASKTLTAGGECLPLWKGQWCIHLFQKRTFGVCLFSFFACFHKTTFIFEVPLKFITTSL